MTFTGRVLPRLIWLTRDLDLDDYDELIVTLLTCGRWLQVDDDDELIMALLTMGCLELGWGWRRWWRWGFGQSCRLDCLGYGVILMKGWTDISLSHQGTWSDYRDSVIHLLEPENGIELIQTGFVGWRRSVLANRYMRATANLLLLPLLLLAVQPSPFLHPVLEVEGGT